MCCVHGGVQLFGIVHGHGNRFANTASISHFDYYYFLFFGLPYSCCFLISVNVLFSFFSPFGISVLSNRLTCVHMLKTPYSAKMEFVTSESNLCPKIMFVVMQFFPSHRGAFQIVFFFFYVVSLFFNAVVCPLSCCSPHSLPFAWSVSIGLHRSSYRSRVHQCELHLINAFNVRDVRSSIFYYFVCYFRINVPFSITPLNGNCRDTEIEVN